MEHPPKQGLKLQQVGQFFETAAVLMEHPPKQGLKLIHRLVYLKNEKSFNGTSTKTRIETKQLESYGFKMGKF